MGKIVNFEAAKRAKEAPVMSDEERQRLIDETELDFHGGLIDENHRSFRLSNFRPEDAPVLLDLEGYGVDSETAAEIRRRAQEAVAAGPLAGTDCLYVWWQMPEDNSDDNQPQLQVRYV